MVLGEVDNVTFKLLECVRKCLDNEECKFYATLMFAKEVMKDLQKTMTRGQNEPINVELSQ